ncbi:DUF6578 domain-containing protein [Pseudonocardia saturnea]
MAPAPLVPVWMDSWQYECCGAPFAVGDRVRWTLQPADLEFLAPPLGALLPDWTVDDLPLIRADDPIVVGRGDLAVVLAPGQPHRVGLLAEDHHVGIPEGAPATAGTVASIRVVRWRTEERPPGGRAWYPVPGSAELEDVAEAVRPGGEGFLVELAVRY